MGQRVNQSFWGKSIGLGQINWSGVKTLFHVSLVGKSGPASAESSDRSKCHRRC